MSATSPLVWFITGTSAGLGRDLTLAALNRGDKVIATARAPSLGKLDDLKAQGAAVVELDVTSSLDTLKEAAKNAVQIYGRVDVVVNNAGYILSGPLESSTPEETQDQFNTNVFGALNVSRAFLPYMRERKTGTIVFIGSLGGWRAVPNAGIYAATKYAVRGLSATLNAEIAPLGLRSVCFDFGYFRTSFLASRPEFESRIEDYLPMSKKSDQALRDYNGKQPGDPKKGVEVIIDVVKDEGVAKGKGKVDDVTLGSDCLQVVRAACETTLKRLGEWEEVSKSTDF